MIEPTDVAARRDDVAIALFEEGSVLYDPAANRLLSLNPTAAVVWEDLDGVTTVDALASALAEEFGADPEVVRDDVAAVIDELAASGVVVVRAEDGSMRQAAASES